MPLELRSPIRGKLNKEKKLYQIMKQGKKGQKDTGQGKKISKKINLKSCLHKNMNLNKKKTLKKLHNFLKCDMLCTYSHIQRGLQI